MKKEWNYKEHYPNTNETVSNVVDKKARFVPAKVEEGCNVPINHTIN